MSYRPTLSEFVLYSDDFFGLALIGMWAFAYWFVLFA